MKIAWLLAWGLSWGHAVALLRFATDESLDEILEDERHTLRAVRLESSPATWSQEYVQLLISCDHGTLQLAREVEKRLKDTTFWCVGSDQLKRSIGVFTTAQEAQQILSAIVYQPDANYHSSWYGVTDPLCVTGGHETVRMQLSPVTTDIPQTSQNGCVVVDLDDRVLETGSTHEKKISVASVNDAPTVERESGATLSVHSGGSCLGLSGFKLGDAEAVAVESDPTALVPILKLELHVKVGKLRVNRRSALQNAIHVVGDAGKNTGDATLAWTLPDLADNSLVMKGAISDLDDFLPAVEYCSSPDPNVVAADKLRVTLSDNGFCGGPIKASLSTTLEMSKQELELRGDLVDLNAALSSIRVDVNNMQEAHSSFMTFYDGQTYDLLALALDSIQSLTTSGITLDELPGIDLFQLRVQNRVTSPLDSCVDAITVENAIHDLSIDKLSVSVRRRASSFISGRRPAIVNVLINGSIVGDSSVLTTMMDTPASLGSLSLQVDDDDQGWEHCNNTTGANGCTATVELSLFSAHGLVTDLSEPLPQENIFQESEPPVSLARFIGSVIQANMYLQRQLYTPDAKYHGPDQIVINVKYTVLGPGMTEDTVLLPVYVLPDCEAPRFSWALSGASTLDFRSPTRAPFSLPELLLTREGLENGYCQDDTVFRVTVQTSQGFLRSKVLEVARFDDRLGLTFEGRLWDLNLALASVEYQFEIRRDARIPVMASVEAHVYEKDDPATAVSSATLRLKFVGDTRPPEMLVRETVTVSEDTDLMIGEMINSDAFVDLAEDSTISISVHNGIIYAASVDEEHTEASSEQQFRISYLRSVMLNLHYVPNLNFNGIDEIDFKVQGQRSTLYVYVQPVNDPPTGDITCSYRAYHMNLLQSPAQWSDSLDVPAKIIADIKAAAAVPLLHIEGSIEGPLSTQYWQVVTLALELKKTSSV
ncbi:hypothetical protein PRIC2_014732 [Phytophthora ramorum]